MDVSRIISKKRDGLSLNDSELTRFSNGLADGTVNDAQAGAFAMAVLLRGMEAPERTALTAAMRDTGSVLTWALAGPVLDKHSTGGVGDNVSLVLAPALAACGAYVPMISGRGLGHTGGTVDKLEAIPGYQSEVSLEKLRETVAETGCAIVGTTQEIAPADRRLYGIRDTTGTVESVDLITASILSKKLAAGLEGLVLDVKTGVGAFMQDRADAERLARALVEVANAAGCPTTALVTDMNEPLARSAGNALEVANAIALLRGDEIDNRLWDATVALGGAVLELGGLAERAGEGQSMIVGALQDGSAAEHFSKMVTALGGPSDVIDTFREHLPRAPVVGEVLAKTSGFVTAIDTRAIGETVVDLGGGRRRADDAIDPAVGLDDLAGIGLMVDAQTPLATVHAASEKGLERAKVAVQAAFSIGSQVPDDAPLILNRIER